MDTYDRMPTLLGNFKIRPLSGLLGTKNKTFLRLSSLKIMTTIHLVMNGPTKKKLECTFQSQSKSLLNQESFVISLNGYFLKYLNTLVTSKIRPL